ncbi:MAG: 3'-5' exonuclease domain-containing protein 2 [Paludibacteraceae bacterium]|nr:3'-5' exonuclease domain-containing protein 2 [Paludibacteraceae bacterium]
MYQKRITREELDLLPSASFEGRIVVVDTPEGVLPATEELSKADTIGLDTESRPSFQRGVFHPVSLLQLSTMDTCYLFRLNKIGGLPLEVAQILSSTKIKKIGLAMKDDIIGLARHHRFRASNCIDLQKIINEYGIVDMSLQKIFAIVFQAKMSKAQRLTNWEAPELTPQQLKYAATDAWATLMIYEQLMRSPKLTPQEIIKLKAEILAEQIAASNNAREQREAYEAQRQERVQRPRQFIRDNNWESNK